MHTASRSIISPDGAFRRNGGRAFILGIALLFVATLGVLTAALAGPPEEKAPGDVVAGALSRLHLATPQAHRGMVIVPLEGRIGEAAAVQTLSEALAAHHVMVTEIGEGRVNELAVRNDGSTPVFIMAGQILVGAKQNRVLQNDLLLPPHSGQVSVAAFCVQHGRWSYTGDAKFSHSDNVSNPSVRYAARASKAQAKVWGAVARTQETVAAPNSTGDLDQTYNARPVREEARDYEAAFGDLPARFPQMHGAAVLVGGRVLAVDLFGNRHVLQSLWPSLLASYALEAGRTDTAATSGAASLTHDLLARARTAVVNRLASPGSGALVELQGAQVSGSALLVAGSVLHLEVFPHTAGATSASPTELPLQRRY